MRLIIEGCDGSGKTTLINNLGLPHRVHLKAMRGGVGGSTAAGWGGQDEAPTAYAKQILGAPEGTAFDRFYLSELVYGPLLRGTSDVTTEETILVDRVLRAQVVQTILCVPPFTTTLRNVQQEGRERPSYQTLPFLRSAFAGFLSLAEAHRVVRYNYLQDLVPLRENLEAGDMCRLPAQVIGSPGAKYLIVTTDNLFLPLLSMQDPSAAMINQALWYAGIREEDMAFTNARHWTAHSRGLRGALLASTQTVIAVGLEAYHAVQRDIMEANHVMAVPDRGFTTMVQTLRTIRDMTEG